MYLSKGFLSMITDDLAQPFSLSTNLSIYQAVLNFRALPCLLTPSVPSLKKIMKIPPHGSSIKLTELTKQNL